jgi:hypothetical protein
MSTTGIPTVTYPPRLLHECAVLKAAYALCAGSGNRTLEMQLLTRLHEIEDGY